MDRDTQLFVAFLFVPNLPPYIHFPRSIPAAADFCSCIPGGVAGTIVCTHGSGKEEGRIRRLAPYATSMWTFYKHALFQRVRCSAAQVPCHLPYQHANDSIFFFAGAFMRIFPVPVLIQGAGHLVIMFPNNSSQLDKEERREQRTTMGCPHSAQTMATLPVLSLRFLLILRCVC